MACGDAEPQSRLRGCNTSTGRWCGTGRNHDSLDIGQSSLNTRRV